jgi:hypothetical protein
VRYTAASKAAGYSNFAVKRTTLTKPSPDQREILLLRQAGKLGRDKRQDLADQPERLRTEIELGLDVLPVCSTGGHSFLAFLALAFSAFSAETRRRKPKRDDWSRDP